MSDMDIEWTGRSTPTDMGDTSHQVMVGKQSIGVIVSREIHDDGLMGPAVYDAAERKIRGALAAGGLKPPIRITRADL